MLMVKIQIENPKGRAKAMVQLARKGRIICLPDHVYVVPEPASDLLKEMGVAFAELGRGGLDYAEKTLRDSTAGHSQRRATG